MNSPETNLDRREANMDTREVNLDTREEHRNSRDAYRNNFLPRTDATNFTCHIQHDDTMRPQQPGGSVIAAKKG